MAQNKIKIPRAQRASADTRGPNGRVYPFPAGLRKDYLSFGCLEGLFVQIKTLLSLSRESYYSTVTLLARFLG